LEFRLKAELNSERAFILSERRRGDMSNSFGIVGIVALNGIIPCDDKYQMYNEQWQIELFGPPD
jgi:hypothetical protein